MDELTPSTRSERFYDAIINGTTPPDLPITRKERYLAKIAGEDVDVDAPITREEFFLAKIAGENVTLPEPITRVEKYLAKIAGEEVEVDDPVTREEMYLAEWADVAGYEETTVTGVSPVVLEAAIHAYLKSLRQYGLCTQADTPTPSDPVPIVCNNGTLKMVHLSGLPDGYRLLEYVGGSGSQYVITNLYLASTDVVECEYRNSSTTGYGAIYGIYKTGESSALYGNQTYYGYDQGNNKVDTGVSGDTNWHSARHDFVNGTLTIDGATTTFTPWTFSNGTKNAVLSRYYNGSYGYNWKGYVRKFKVTRGNDVVCDLLPAKDSNDVAGLYDLISGNFYTATGGTLLEGNEVDDYELRIVGTPESISITASGADAQTATAGNLLSCGDYADEQDIISGVVTRKVEVKVFKGDTTESWARVGTSADGNRCYKYDVSDGGKRPILSTHYVYGNVTRQADMHEGEAYINGTWLVFDGGTATTVDEWKAFLAAQYAAGTPVIVICPLATETTESVTAQPLTTAEGNNVVSVSANVSPISLEVIYDKKKTA